MEKLFKNGIKIIFAVLIIGLLFYLFTGGSSEEDEASKKAKTAAANELSILFGGGPGGESGNNENGSIFESDFYKSGNVSYEEKTAESEDADGETPINPQTGKPYNPEAMAQFDELRKKFPTNSLIPKRLTDADKEAKTEMDKKIAAAANKVYSKTAKPDEIKIHYDNVLKQAFDRKEIIEYLINNRGMAAEDSENKDKVKEIYEVIQKQYKEAEDQRSKAFAEAGIPVDHPENIGNR